MRWLAVTNAKGVGLLAVGMPHLGAAVRHFTHEDIWNAKHTYELTRRPETYLNLDFAQMGVGGDDSWGALAARAVPVAREGVQLSLPAAAFLDCGRRDAGRAGEEGAGSAGHAVTPGLVRAAPRHTLCLSAWCAPHRWTSHVAGCG